MKVYVIEETNSDFHGIESFRYRSLVKGVVGPWRYGNKDKAKKDGEQHQAIMERLYPQLRDDYQGSMAIHNLGELSSVEDHE